MAHVGKHYKLWFRRDASWELNNYAFGWPEAYHVHQHGLLASARYRVEVVDLKPAINLSKDYSRIWRSETLGNIFDNAYWQVEFPGVPDEKIDRVKFGIWHDAVIDTPLLSATYRFSESSPVYYNLPAGAMTQLHFLSPDIVCDPIRFAPWLFASRWDRYNP